MLHSILKQKGSKKIKTQNFGLTEEEFEHMLANMKDGDDSLFEHLFLSQFEESIKYLKNRFKISHSKAYDCCMDALLKFRTRLLEDKIKYSNMRFLFTQIASQFFIDSTKQPTFLNEDYLAFNSVQSIEESNEDFSALEALDKAWKQLCDNCLFLLKGFYYDKTSLKSLAVKLNESDSTIRKRKQRCLETLRKNFLTYYQA